MIQPYHFTKDIDIGKDFIRFFEKVTSCNGIVCFDFEDSINSASHNQLTFLKNSHRKTIINELQAISSRIKLDRIGFRINGIGTVNYDFDIEDLDILECIHCVFLPKVEHVSQVEKLLQDIPKVVQEIIPIIETQKGFANIKEILSIKDLRFSKIAFGHCDFNLSNQNFPFFHQDSKVYWDWINKLVLYAGITGKQVINSPVLNLENGEYFSQVILKNKSFQNMTGQITLCLKQTLLCAGPEPCSELKLISEIASNADKLELAVKVVQQFERYKLEDRYFAIDENRILISPQEYQLAKIILESNTV